MATDQKSYFEEAEHGGPVVLQRTLMSDRLTPVLAYRALVQGDDRAAPSFLFESVEQGGGAARVGRNSILGARPRLEVVARGSHVRVTDHRDGTVVESIEADPLAVPRRLAPDRPLATPDSALPDCFTGGWIGYIGYDSVRWMEPGKIPFDSAAPDDRNLPDMHLGLYEEVVSFDHVSKMIHVLVLSDPALHSSTRTAYDKASSRLDELVSHLSGPSVSLTPGFVDLDVAARGDLAPSSNFERSEFERSVEQVREYIRAGDAFQVVLSQRFRRTTTVDPFDLYRALRVVNPSPYQIYLQAEGCMLVAASPEILCRVRDSVVTSRPLAGTRPRGGDVQEDLDLEHELLSDEKERAEHVMLVDLARNDLGRACDTASISIDACMEIERYSHVMHISSTVTGRLREGLDQWDALRATLPVGTVSGAPKVRAMQIIDEMEPTRRGPYAGGIGAVGLGGGADIALALRTLVVTRNESDDAWVVDLQAGAGIVLDSDPASEYQETLSKAAALGRAIDLAEQAFGLD